MLSIFSAPITAAVISASLADCLAATVRFAAFFAVFNRFIQHFPSANRQILAVAQR